ncbi:UvrD-helicase domain-containing protein [Peptoniphilus lacydonensis]|uniref:UvrD-helicase domain-containing protein n=1 Tax=Peptoniphilus lacydonensis TaxID=1673725 RepID=UPI003736A5B7
MKLNEVQLEAVNSIDTDVTLMAGAGTGKTRVLTSRFINIVKKYKNPEKILALTFTKKAAEEMRGRISKELVKGNISFDERDLNIMTIHSFGAEIIKDYSINLGINPNFKILEENQSKKILENSVIKVLNSIEELEYKNYLLDFNSSPFEEKDLFISLYLSFKNNNFDFDEILNKSLNFDKEKCDFNNLIILLEEYRKVSGKKFKNFYDENISELKSLEFYNLEVLNCIEESLGTSKKYIEKIEDIQEYILVLKKNLEEKNKDYYKIIIKILKEIHKSYQNEKKKIGVIDYDDIILYTNCILKDRYCQKSLKDRYSHILVDEYQDTNELQNNIINTFENSNLFIVGDPKQSIYGFRGTDIKSYFNFSDKIKNRGKSLDMNKNYRSDGKIIKFINKTFENLIEPYDSIDYSYESGGDVYFYNSEDNKEIVNLIEDLLKKYEEKDVAILSRSNAQIDEISKILTTNNIKFNKGSRNVSEIEVLKVTKNILSTIYSSDDFISTLSLFNSPILNFKFKDLAEILNANVENFNDLIEHKSFNDNINYFINFLIELKNKSKFLQIDELIDEIMIYFFNLNTIKLSDFQYLCKFKEITNEFFENNTYDYRDYEKFISLQNFEDLEEGINLLTIHKSKGLEFDVVIISHMDVGKNNSPREKIIVDKDLGLAIKSDFSDYRYKEISNRIKDIYSEEEKRILYVAMTRAKRELILFGNYDNPKKSSYFDLIGKDNCTNNYKNSKNLEVKKEERNDLIYLDLDISFENRIREYYTVTDFINYKRSPVDFYKKYFLGIDKYTKGSGKNQLIDPKTLGNIIHLFAKEYSSNYIDNEDIDEILKGIFKFYEEEINDEKLNIARKLALNYLEMEENNILEKELLFYYDLEGFLVKGYIDQVIKIYDKYYIVDLKTGNLSIERFKEIYEDQLIIYAKIYEYLYNVKVEGAYIFDLRGKNKIIIEINEEKSKNIMNGFLNYIKFLRTHTFYNDYL